jgi:hypothetical protein
VFGFLGQAVGLAAQRRSLPHAEEQTRLNSLHPAIPSPIPSCSKNDRTVEYRAFIVDLPQPQAKVLKETGI